MPDLMLIFLILVKFSLGFNYNQLKDRGKARQAIKYTGSRNARIPSKLIL